VIVIDRDIERTDGAIGQFSELGIRRQYLQQGATIGRQRPREATRVDRVSHHIGESSRLRFRRWNQIVQQLNSRARLALTEYIDHGIIEQMRLAVRARVQQHGDRLDLVERHAAHFIRRIARVTGLVQCRDAVVIGIAIDKVEVAPGGGIQIRERSIGTTRLERAQHAIASWQSIGQAQPGQVEAAAIRNRVDAQKLWRAQRAHGHGDLGLVRGQAALIEGVDGVDHIGIAAVCQRSINIGQIVHSELSEQRAVAEQFVAADVAGGTRDPVKDDVRFVHRGRQVDGIGCSHITYACRQDLGTGTLETERTHRTHLVAKFTVEGGVLVARRRQYFTRKEAYMGQAHWQGTIGFKPVGAQQSQADLITVIMLLELHRLHPARGITHPFQCYPGPVAQALDVVVEHTVSRAEPFNLDLRQQLRPIQRER